MTVVTNIITAILSAITSFSTGIATSVVGLFEGLVVADGGGLTAFAGFTFAFVGLAIILGIFRMLMHKVG